MWVKVQVPEELVAQLGRRAAAQLKAHLECLAADVVLRELQRLTAQLEAKIQQIQALQAAEQDHEQHWPPAPFPSQTKQ